MAGPKFQFTKCGENKIACWFLVGERGAISRQLSGGIAKLTLLGYFSHCSNVKSSNWFKNIRFSGDL